MVQSADAVSPDSPVASVVVEERPFTWTEPDDVMPPNPPNLPNQPNPPAEDVAARATQG